MKKIPFLNLKESVNCVLDAAKKLGLNDGETLMMLARFIKAVQDGTIPIHSVKKNGR